MNTPLETLETPIYRPIEGLLLIGVEHHVDALANQKKVKEFVRKIEHCRHILLEGNDHSTEREKTGKPLSYEGVAALASNFKEYTVHSLENAINLVELAEKYGLHASLYPLLDTFQTVHSIVYQTTAMTGIDLDMRKKLSLIYEDARPIIVQEWQSNMGTQGKPRRTYARVSIKGVMQAMDTIARYATLGQILDASNFFVRFERHIRDYEVLGPNARSIMKTARGKKAMIVGLRHVDPLIDYFSGRLQKPLPWDTSLAELYEKNPSGTGRETVKFLRKIEKAI